MNLEARYSNRQGSWYVADSTGSVEIDSTLYDTKAEAVADFQTYLDTYTDPATADDTTDEEWHDMPLTGQDTVDTGKDDLTTKAAANLNVPVGLSGKHRAAYLALTDEQKRIYRHHYIAMGQFAQQAWDAALGLREDVTGDPAETLARVTGSTGATVVVERVSYGPQGRTLQPVTVHTTSDEPTPRAQLQAGIAQAMASTPLTLWRIQRVLGVKPGQMRACIVAAPSQDTARQVAARNAHGEYPGVWWNLSTSCTRIGQADLDATEGLIMADVLEG